MFFSSWGTSLSFHMVWNRTVSLPLNKGPPFLFSSTGVDTEPGALPLLIWLMVFVTSKSGEASSSAFWSVWAMLANASSFTLEK